MLQEWEWLAAVMASSKHSFHESTILDSNIGLFQGSNQSIQ